MSIINSQKLSIPSHFSPQKIGEVWRVPYQQIAVDARKWSAENNILPASTDEKKVCLLLIDVQNTFCIPKIGRASCRERV